MGYLASKTNPKSQGFREKAHLNWMGGASYFMNSPIATLRMAAASCFFGEPQYYHRDNKDTRSLRHSPSSRLTDSNVKVLQETLDCIMPESWRGMSPSEMMEKAIDAALDHDVEATLEVAVNLRHEDYIRTTPQVILVRAAMHPKAKGTGLIRKYATRIITRADEPAVGLSYFGYLAGGKGNIRKIPNSLKKAYADALARFDSYQLAKYRLEGHKISTVDVVRLVHPERTEAIDALYKGNLKVTDKTWEGIISSKGSSKETWEESLEVMGHMALLRNLRNLIEKGVSPSLFVDKLVDGVLYGKQLPFRYYSAYNSIKHLASPKVLDAVEKCLEISFENSPKFSGRVMSLCDNSGSATGTTTSSLGTMRVCDIANLTGVITGKMADEGYVGIFGDHLETFPVRGKSSIFDLVDKSSKIGSNIGGSTENGIWLFWDNAIKQEEHWDHVFVYSDMQAGHGGLYGTDGSKYRDYIWGGKGGGGIPFIDVPKLISTYRQKVNPNVNVYLVQVAGYRDTIAPEFYNRTYILGGWGPGILKFAAKASGICDEKSQ